MSSRTDTPAHPSPPQPANNTYRPDDGEVLRGQRLLSSLAQTLQQGLLATMGGGSWEGFGQLVGARADGAASRHARAAWGRLMLHRCHHFQYTSDTHRHCTALQRTAKAALVGARMVATRSGLARGSAAPAA